MLTIHSPSSPPDHKPELARIRKLSLILGYACLAIACAIPLMPLLAIGLAALTGAPVPSRLPLPSQEPLSAWMLATLGILNVLPMIFLVIGLWTARACFKRFARGEFFAASAIRALRKFSIWAALSAATALVGHALLTLALSPHFQQVLFSIASSGHWLTLTFAGMLWVMAAMINHGRSLAEENEAFV